MSNFEPVKDLDTDCVVVGRGGAFGTVHRIKEGEKAGLWIRWMKRDNFKSSFTVSVNNSYDFRLRYALSDDLYSSDFDVVEIYRITEPRHLLGIKQFIDSNEPVWTAKSSPRFKIGDIISDSKEKKWIIIDVVNESIPYYRGLRKSNEQYGIFTLYVAAADRECICLHHSSSVECELLDL